jgi:predicted AlkP superfamily pyrophosphatase or phosphodiesterase
MVRLQAVPRIPQDRSRRRGAPRWPVALALAVALCGVVAGGAAAVEEGKARGAPAVILISLDGTTPEAVRAAELPTLLDLARRGAAASRLVPVFPSNTFPNHVSLVTGVAPEVHGIVANVFLDPERGLFRYSDDPTWIEVEPIWSIATRNGVVSAAFHWVGSEGPWRNGHGPRYWKRFDADTPETEKVDQMLAWLDLPEPLERPRLITAWFRGGDRAGHRHGPASREVHRTLRAQDRALAGLIAGLEARGAFATTTLLLVSDHGMLPVERHADLDAALRDRGVVAKVLGGGGFVPVSVRGGSGEAARAVSVARALDLEAYPRREAPAELRLGHSRFGDVAVLAPPGVAIARSEALRPAMRGSHGYRPEVRGMGAIFVAFGRGARPGAELGEVRAVDVAPTVLALLGIPAPRWMEGSPIAKLVPPAAGSGGDEETGGAR